MRGVALNLSVLAPQVDENSTGRAGSRREESVIGMDNEDWLRFLSVLADRADGIAMGLFRSPRLGVRQKPGAGAVSDADLRIEEDARRLVGEAWPGLGVLGEEFGETGGGDARLIIDPIDATNNYVCGIPIFATLLAIEVAGEVVAGLASAPALGVRWSATRGGGARRNGQPMQVSRVDRLDQAQVFHSALGGAVSLASHPGMLQLLRGSRRQRGFGDFYQHMLVAEGAGEIAVDLGLAPWDIAALMLVVEEAGGRATALDGRRCIDGGSLLSSNGLLHARALELLGTPPGAAASGSG